MSASIIGLIGSRSHLRYPFQGYEKSGRIDGREFHVLPAGALAEQFPEWKELASIGVAISYRIENMNKYSIEYRYYISSAELTPEQFSSAARGHWAIENSLHWVLDVVMNEDACQIYRDDAPQILACVRHMAQNMLRAETSRKASLRKKQQFAGMSNIWRRFWMQGWLNRPKFNNPFTPSPWLGVAIGQPYIIRSPEWRAHRATERAPPLRVAGQRKDSRLSGATHNHSPRHS